MGKTLYCEKYGTYINIPRTLYKQLAKIMAKDQIAEFQISFDKFNQNPDLSIKEVVFNLMAFSNLIRAENFLDELNESSDKEGNIDWPKLLDKYRVDKDIQIIYN